MTKQQLHKILDQLTEEVVLLNGGQVHDTMIICGGKPQKSRVAVGGRYDLNAARGILAYLIEKHKDLITGATPAPAVNPPAVGGPIIGPDGRVHLPAQQPATA